MKKQYLAGALAAAAALALPGAASAQTAAPAAPAAAATTPRPDIDPALWVVRDADTTIYLFGTFHLLDGRSDWFNDEVRAAFDRSGELVLEAPMPENPAELQPVVMRYAVAQDGKTLAQRLPAALNTRLNAELTELGLPPAALQQFEPWFVSMTMAVMGGQRMGITGEHGPEAILTAAARARSIPISGVETMESQIAMFDAMPEALQLAQLEQTIDGMDKLTEMLGAMNRAWAEGNIEGLVTMMNESMRQAPEAHRIIFTERNARWAEWIRERMARPGTVFMAVGAGHLAGDDSVQAVLARSGVRTARVTE
jgi:uncharacterized protein YbaP (TraB family)